MIKGFFINFLGAACVAPLLLSAQDFTLGLPVDCDMETHCYIQQYMDHDPSKNASDMRCGPLTYDGHSGTDFAIRNPLKIPTGVNVIASAPGTIKALRDGIQDVPYSSNNANNVKGQECGNGVVVAHSGGWETQYCHLKNGSIAVRVGDTVQQGSVLGKIGLSGRTQFPHVHVSVRRNGNRIDPFAPRGRSTCDAASETLWSQPVNYVAGGLLSLRFFETLPQIETHRFGRPSPPITNTSPAIVVSAFGFGALSGDTITIEIHGPKSLVFEHTVKLDRNQAQFIRSGGKKRTRKYWRSGTYRARAVMMRNNEIISELKTELIVR